MKKFKDKVTIITGGASGIGRELCEECGRQKAMVIVADINGEGAEQVAAAINAAGGRAWAVTLDVTKGEDVRRLIEETAATHGRLDYMFNNAGIAIQGEMRDMDPEQWKRIIDINLWGVIHGTTAAYELMVRQGFGHIVNTSSLTGLIGMSLTTAYGATKHAIVGLSTSLRAEGAGLGVKVSVVCPGIVKTGLFDAATVVGINKDEFYSRIEKLMMDSSQVAQIILRAVARNEAIIVFPTVARFLWRLARIHPSLYAPVNYLSMHGFRRYREKKVLKGGPS